MYRHEYKYLISNLQCKIIEQRLKGLLQLDKNAKGRGFYTIRSLYFDDYYDSCYWDNINGCNPREKWRIRIYDENFSKAFLERKRKINGKTLKDIARLSICDVENVMGGKPIKDTADIELLNEFDILMRIRCMHPTVIVGYMRIPYVSALGNVRITFDKNIYSCKNVWEFLKTDIARRPVLPPHIHLLEIKWDAFLPDVIHDACCLDNLEWTTFSKYTICRKISTR